MYFKGLGTNNPRLQLKTAADVAKLLLIALYLLKYFQIRSVINVY